MIILHLEQSKEPGIVEIKAVMDDAEFEQLLGNLDELRVFAAKTITEPASVVQTGARHSYAKYLLFPVRLRRQFKTDEYDFENLRCGALRGKDRLYVIYEVARGKSLGKPTPPDMEALAAVEEAHRIRG